jgi:cellulose synthase/poly-beta-1,6-N-acetylglucosamine synthase-like glycosyltransferase/peptidoglycan/xylan/chitin deacetylase (PgdA/CDA1 family)
MGGKRKLRGEPRSHWVMLILLLVTVFALLVIAGVASGQLGEGTHEPKSRASGARVPEAVLKGGPVVDPSRPDAPGLRMPDHHVALTFDDGPSTWTAKILDELKRRNVKATFFVIGTRVADRPDLVRRMLAEGHEVGVHTMTHVNMANVPGWRLRLELDQTQLAIAAATGKTTDLLRPPFSSLPRDLHPSDWQALEETRDYRVVLADLDTEDWRRRGVSKIVARGTPAGGKGAVIMLHDGGGNRSQTVKAVDQLITDLKDRGYSFDTVTQGVGVPKPWHAASRSERVEGDVSVTVINVAALLVDVLRIAFLALAALAVARTLLLLLLARRHVRRLPTHAVQSHPGVSVVVPAYNEELGIAASVRSLAASDYPLFEIIVVDDGSTDATSEVVRSLAIPGLRLIRQENSGKPAALNTGIAAAQYPVLVLVDGDTVFEPDAMKALVAPLADPDIGAVSGNTKVGNRGGLLGRWQHIEYVIGFNLDRRMFDVLQCMPTVPGAIGAFRRSALEQVGGVSDETLAEDTDLTMAICRDGWRVVYAPEARAWTEAPASLGQLWRQRYRWCYGTMQSMWKHRRSVVERGASGKLGRRGLPYLLAFQVMLPLIAPVIDIAAVYTLIFLSTPTVVYVWLAFLALQYVGAIYAFRLDGERLGPLWSLGLQQFVYRQLMYLVVIQSTASAVHGIRLRWHKLRRTGDLESAPIRNTA